MVESGATHRPRYKSEGEQFTLQMCKRFDDDIGNVNVVDRWDGSHCKWSSGYLGLSGLWGRWECERGLESEVTFHFMDQRAESPHCILWLFDKFILLRIVRGCVPLSTNVKETRTFWRTALTNSVRLVKTKQRSSWVDHSWIAQIAFIDWRSGVVPGRCAPSRD